jgi:hypothetical protein
LGPQNLSVHEKDIAKPLYFCQRTFLRPAAEYVVSVLRELWYGATAFHVLADRQAIASALMHIPRIATPLVEIRVLRRRLGGRWGLHRVGW